MSGEKECRYCGTEQIEEGSGRDYPPYSYDEWICNDCWENCPECGCSEWNKITSSSSRSHNKKVCEDCGHTFITKAASG